MLQAQVAKVRVRAGVRVAEEDSAARRWLEHNRMVISVASGKGGTGKTTIATSLALSLSSVQLLDCDVEEPNVHIFLRAQHQKSEVVSIPIPEIEDAKCNYCGECAKVCAYNALAVLKDRVLVFPHLCHGCGGCSLLCPQKAISEINKEIGVVEEFRTPGLQFVRGTLNVGEVMAPPLVRAVKRNIRAEKTVIIDAAPGTSCPVIEAIKGSDFCILVTEPTPFGLNDLILAVEVVRMLRIPFGVVINRAGLGDKKVEEYCRNENIRILMQIPFDRKIAVAYSKGIPLVKADASYIMRFKAIYQSIENYIHEG